MNATLSLSYQSVCPLISQQLNSQMLRRPAEAYAHLGDVHEDSPLASEMNKYYIR
jgi:hypothetical protein